MADPTMDVYLAPTWFLDADSPEVAAFALRAVGDATSDVDRAVRLHYAIRDGIRYDPYLSSHEPDRYRASTVAELPAAYCVQKAILMAAACRHLGIPARLGYADVRNHLSSPKLLELMGTDLFVFHGYTDVFLEGRWVKTTPVFNRELCERFGVRPLEFDGRSDSMLHEFDAKDRRHMEYVAFRGTFADFPHGELLAAFRETYPQLFSKSSETAREAGKTHKDPLFHGEG
jgi:transglutaminase-like putative cysteine protease